MNPALLRIAQDAGISDIERYGESGTVVLPEELERFAALIADDVAAHVSLWFDKPEIAAAIRARFQPPKRERQ